MLVWTWPQSSVSVTACISIHRCPLTQIKRCPHRISMSKSRCTLSDDKSATFLSSPWTRNLLRSKAVRAAHSFVAMCAVCSWALTERITRVFTHAWSCSLQSLIVTGLPTFRFSKKKKTKEKVDNGHCICGNACVFNWQTCLNYGI